MSKNPLLASTLILSMISASGQVTFHTDFDEADLASTGLTIDTPNTDLLTTDSGTVTLNTTDGILEMASNGANLWGDREGAPIAWVASPTVAVGRTWYVETTLTHEDTTGANTEWDQAGITFYSGVAGSSPGSENTGGAVQSLFVGISDWNAWDHRVQGFADNMPNATAAATVGDDTFEYRAEVTEGGVMDVYNFFYREDPADPWTQFGPVDLEQDFDNTAVGLFTKSHNNNTESSTQFDRFTIGLLPLTTDVVLCITEAGGSLDFSWESNLGEEYALLSSTDLSTSPSTWVAFSDGTTTYENIAASGTGTTSLAGLAGVDETRFFALEVTQLPRSVVFTTDFETDAGGFSTLALTPTWEWGAPNGTGVGGNIQAANSGVNAWGTDLDGPAPVGALVTLSSPAIDLTGLSVDASLSFFENLDIDSSDSTAFGEVWVVNDATGVAIGSGPVYTAQDQDVSSTAWESVGPIELPSGALGETIRLEFRYNSGTDASFLGWYIDDVTVEGL